MNWFVSSAYTDLMVQKVMQYSSKTFFARTSDGSIRETHRLDRNLTMWHDLDCLLLCIIFSRC